MTTYNIERIPTGVSDLPVMLTCQSCKLTIDVKELAVHTFSHNSFHIQIEPAWIAYPLGLAKDNNNETSPQTPP